MPAYHRYVTKQQPKWAPGREQVKTMCKIRWWSFQHIPVRMLCTEKWLKVEWRKNVNCTSQGALSQWWINWGRKETLFSFRSSGVIQATLKDGIFVGMNCSLKQFEGRKLSSLFLLLLFFFFLYHNQIKQTVISVNCGASRKCHQFPNLIPKREFRKKKCENCSLQQCPLAFL